MADTSGVKAGTSVALSLDGVTKRFGDTVAVDDVSLDVAAGEFVAILGPSGSGKTTLMRLVAGFESPESGSIRLGGRIVNAVPADKRPVNTVFQNYALFPHLSVVDNVAYGLRMRGIRGPRRRARARELLDLVRLTAFGTAKPHELSGGMQQRVALARALAREPEVLLLDEPLGALDRKLRDDMQAELRRIHTELGTTFVYVTHDQDEAFGLADRLVIMRAGRIEQLGEPGAVYDRPGSAWAANFVGDANAITGTYRPDGDGARIETDLGEFLAGAPIGSIEPGHAATMLIRPENLSLSPVADQTRADQTRADQTRAADGVRHRPERANAISVRIRDQLAVGSRLKVTAVTPGGKSFEILQPRPGRTGLSDGDDAILEFERSAVLLYAADDPGDAPAPMKG
ncbi:ABC transporter ATP-binding protein [Spelaeicoccus albus]|uniref:ABC-type quaternary amine transporter n=1 Tax=Spelaeicoccus albus TaxID=1280376 RepID=A0A7Z0AAZ6_9MICO|nr:ABC transporter ATP-binding protein [Spelaeicoccus albus]NYI66328.1 ABC-type Fe3+/spermidine/putrescine transport system ATPase subunit [Spelaeicoccus albus]